MVRGKRCQSPPDLVRGRLSPQPPYRGTGQAPALSQSSGQACSETGYPFSLFCLLYLHYLPPSKLEGERSSFGNSPSASALKLHYACSICPVLGRFAEKPDAPVSSMGRALNSRRPVVIKVSILKTSQTES